MFKNVIINTPFIGDIQTEVLGNVYGDSWTNDVSFVSTLRALVCPRMEGDEFLHFWFRNPYLTQREIEQRLDERVIESLFGDSVLNSNCLCVVNLCGREQDSTAAFNVVDNKLTASYPNFVKVEKFTVFFRKIFRASCFINPDTKTTLVLTDRIDLPKYHFLQIAIPVMLPWYFPAEKKLTPEEMELLESLKEKTPEKYIDVLLRMAGKYDFRIMKIHSQLDRFEAKQLEKQIKDLTSQVNNVMENIRGYEDSIANLMVQYNKLSITLMGYNTKMAEVGENSELSDYFMCNHNVLLDGVDSKGVITFVCRGYLEYYDEDIIREYIEKPRSGLYFVNGSCMEKKIPAEDIKMLFKALFIDEEIRMKFCAMYSLGINGGVRAVRNANYDAAFNDCTPNPHIDRYACLGNHEQAINECMRNGNYIGAIEQCISSCKSLNFADSAVLSEFMSRIYGVSGSNANMKCIELPDGTCVSPKKAIAWLKERHGNETQEEETENG